MLIIGANKKGIVNVDNVTEIFVQENKRKILCTTIGDRLQKDIGSYDSIEKAVRAFGFLSRAIMEGKEVFAMPSNDDERLNTTLRGTGGFRTTQTNRKTK